MNLKIIYERTSQGLIIKSIWIKMKIWKSPSIYPMTMMMIIDQTKTSLISKFKMKEGNRTKNRER